MSIYQAIETAMHGQDPDKYVDLLHDDFQFVRHQSGTTLDKAAMADMIRRLVASGGMAVHDQRCLYENGDILVEHSVMDFPDGTREAVMAVHMLRDGKIIRTETGATPVSK
jgi:SnoaL-like domain